MRKLLVVAVGVGLLVGLVASPVLADKPEVVFEIDFADGPYPWSDLADEVIRCKDGVRHFGDDADFTVLHQIAGHFEDKHFLIKGGTVVRHEGSVSGTDYLINSEDESKMITGKFHTKNQQYSAPGEQPDGALIRGLDWHMVAPGFGTVFIQAGRLELDFTLPGDPFVSFSGRSDLGAFEYDAVCEALS